MLHVRNNMDIVKNNYGNQLLEFCKNNNLFILNGRVNGDKVGMLTCKQTSVVDYCISSVDFLPFIYFLHVLDFSSLYSDVHCPISLSLKSIAATNDTESRKSQGCSCDRKKIKKMGQYKSWGIYRKHRCV